MLEAIQLDSSPLMLRRQNGSPSANQGLLITEHSYISSQWPRGKYNGYSGG